MIWWLLSEHSRNSLIEVNRYFGSNCFESIFSLVRKFFHKRKYVFRTRSSDKRAKLI